MELCERRCCSIPRWVAPRPALLSSQGAWTKNSVILPHPFARIPPCAGSAVLNLMPSTACVSWMESNALSLPCPFWVELPTIGCSRGTNEVVCGGRLVSDLFCWAPAWECGAPRALSVDFASAALVLQKIACLARSPVQVRRPCWFVCVLPRRDSIRPTKKRAQHAHIFSLSEFCRDSLFFWGCGAAAGALCMECVSESV